MCTLAVYFRAYCGFPLVVAANRDEFLSRPSLAPAWIDAGRRIFAGRDARSGGTWLGVNGSGVASALLNRRSQTPPDPSRRSRGLLCLDALRCASASAARRAVGGQSAQAYNPFNLLVADRREAWVASNHGGRLTFSDLTPGLHLLTNLDLDDPECPRISASVRLFAALLEDESLSPAKPELVARLREVLSRHDTALDPRRPGEANSLCLHAGEYGTRSSTLVFLDQAGRWTYWHTDRPPCRGDYQLLSLEPALGAHP